MHDGPDEDSPTGNSGPIQISPTEPSTGSKSNCCKTAKVANQRHAGWYFGVGSNQGSWDLGVVASFGHLIPKRIINIFPMGMLNVHASLLPRWRGAAPIMHAIMNGDADTGITIMRIKPLHFDVGDIVMQETIPIKPDVMAVELTNQLAEIGADLLSRCMSNLEHNLNSCIQQPTEGVTLAPKVTSEMSNINWKNMSASQLFNLWRATQHLFKLQTTFHGQIVKLDGMEPVTENTVIDSEKQTIGKILVDRARGLLLVRCQSDWAGFRHITLNRRPVMTPLDFANGYLKKRTDDQHYFTYVPFFEEKEKYLSKRIGHD
nr:EOG090X0BM2 [Eubosmina coregoni]